MGKNIKCHCHFSIAQEWGKDEEKEYRCVTLWRIRSIFVIVLQFTYRTFRKRVQVLQNIILTSECCLTRETAKQSVYLGQIRLTKKNLL